MRDIRSSILLYTKGVLFLVLGCLAGAILVAEHPSWKVAILLGLAIWGFCRAYYFAFYVIEKYVDGQFRFTGLWGLARYVMSRRGITRSGSSDPNSPPPI